MAYRNISELKNYENFLNSGLGVLNAYLKNLLNCNVNFEHQKISDFESAMHIDISSNLKRYCYKLNNDKVVLSIKVIEKPHILAIMPILLEGPGIANIGNGIYEQIASAITLQISKCYCNSFHGGAQLMGVELEHLIIARCFFKGIFDPSRISYLISYIEKLSHSTFEGKFFSTGFILSRSLFDYKKGMMKQRKGNFYDLNEQYDLIKQTNIDKRLWYLVDGKESFYLFDQRLTLRNAFINSSTYTSWETYFDSYTLKEVLYGSDVAFRTLSQNQVSIMNADGVEFVKIENCWKLRDYGLLKTLISSQIQLDEKVLSALIYYISRCSKENISTIMWIPENCKEKMVDKILLAKSNIFNPIRSILSVNQVESIMRFLSSDGVTIIDRKGFIQFHGGIVDLNTSIAKGLAGTGETAAKILSSNGIAIKISQDGNIKIFYDFNKKPFVF